MALRVLLADDVPAIVRGLKKMIDWERLGLELVGEAVNGDQLLEEIGLKRPDIVISDIAMPGRSGIEVLKELKARKQDTKMIYVSAHREFAYAQEALKYGAVDYLIKPINRERLEGLLEQTAAVIKGEREQEKRLSELELRQKLQQITEAMSRIAEDNLSHELPYLKAELETESEEGLYTVVVMEPCRSAFLTGSWQEGEKRLLYFAIQNLILDLSAGQLQAWPITGAGCFYMVMRHFRDCDLEALLWKWHAETTCCLKIAITFSLGIAVPLERLAVSYRQAAALLPYRYYAGVDVVLTERHLHGGEPESDEVRSQREKELGKAVLTGDTDRIQLLIRGCLSDIAALSWGNRDYTHALVTGLMKRLHAELVQSGASLVFRELPFVDELSGAESFVDAIAGVERVLADWTDEIHAKGTSRELVQFNRIKAYMTEHYADDITLETLSAQFYMNPYYLSAFIKRYMGQNFKSYLTEVRLKKAIQLMGDNEIMLYEIAEQVGFHNSRQFSELFKKHYGMLPNDYRKAIEQGRQRRNEHETN